MAVLAVACFDITIGDTTVKAQVDAGSDPTALPFLYLQQCTLAVVHAKGVNERVDNVVAYCLDLEDLVLEQEPPPEPDP